MLFLVPYLCRVHFGCGSAPKRQGHGNFPSGTSEGKKMFPNKNFESSVQSGPLFEPNNPNPPLEIPSPPFLFEDRFCLPTLEPINGISASTTEISASTTEISASMTEISASTTEISSSTMKSAPLLEDKVIEASEEEKKLIFSEKDAIWSKYSNKVKVGDVFDARVGSVEDYGAFVHLQFPNGQYYLTGLVHISEVSWDLVQDVRDFLSEGNQVKVKVIHIDREKSRITLSIKQLEEDPLLETLDKVIPQEGQFVSDAGSMSSNLNMEPLPGLESICKELLQEDDVTDVRLGRQGLEKRVVSQDLELWLSNIPAKDKQFTLLARAGRQVQEVYLTTTLDLDGIKKAVQRVLGRVP
ncbi:uncharacterized protein LOC109825301 isoform X2 [Asparagus officinalis]|uniref:uncharacterized protein LOC109825301 isoform X2 n=1 Tax=Asparagus officinalis TaxID=4686 RepID=UPI00098E2E0F|nr:uncharacterized protein LOC109825301 isoform X2 [Asparagus officinalis]